MNRFAVYILGIISGMCGVSAVFWGVEKGPSPVVLVLCLAAFGAGLACNLGCED